MVISFNSHFFLLMIHDDVAMQQSQIKHPDNKGEAVTDHLSVEYNGEAIASLLLKITTIFYSFSFFY